MGLLYSTVETYHDVINSLLLFFQNFVQIFISPLVDNDHSVHPLEVVRELLGRTQFMILE
jgi:hypothetical protein